MASHLMQSHEKAVERIAVSVKDFNARNEPFRIFHGSTNSTRQGLQDRTNVVDISELCRIISIDAESRLALVEPNVPMDRLIETTLKHELVPPVVMEFPGITVGGGYAGTGGESSSFKYGFFNETVNRAEFILGNGDIVLATANDYADLLHGASGAVGSLGITTMLEVQLIAAKEFVKTTYYPVRSVKEAIEKLEAASSNHSLDYLDGILFRPDYGAIVTGEMTNGCPAGVHIQTFSHPSDPWYYLHVRESCSRAEAPVTDYIPLAEYLFRYDRGGFWVGESAFEYFKFPFTRFTRWWLDDFLHTRMLYEALHGSNQSRDYVVQDVAMPFFKAVEFIDYTTNTFDIWPLWLCPLRQARTPTFHPHALARTGDGKVPYLLLNVGLWGFGPKNHDTFIAQNLELERKLPDFGAMKWLYAHTYYTQDEFWKIYDKSWYDNLREKYHSNSLPNVWQKVTIDPQVQQMALQTSWSSWLLQLWPLGGLWGLVKAIQSQQYQLARRSQWRYRRGSGRPETKDE
ncbi:MAG: hypothetical protein Q9159_001926 [Coniocarpon cinnabarinum]